MAKLKLGILVGSNRRASINRKLALAYARLGGEVFDSKLLQIDDLPLYNQDNEEPSPPPVARFKAEIAACDALLFVTPEHDRSIPALLKNAIDWGARPYGKNSFRGKPAAVTGTSGGVISTAIAQAHLRAVLGSGIAIHVMGGEAYIQFKPDLIDDQGNVADENVAKFLKTYIEQFAEFAGRLAR
ncbi:MAG TPA: NADPH-dependent FMN reductase [Pseudolabrys sp.]|nr:NADPH-dependent FMN reductase [Pseudolabrys sp.]